MKYDVVGMGEFLVDFACIRTNENGFPTMMGNPGGAVPNCLAAMQKRGIRTAFIAKVGNDAFGRLLLGTAESAGINTDGVIVSDKYFTTLAFVTLDENGDRDFSFSRKYSADIMMDYDEVDKSIIDQAAYFHVGSVSLTDEPSRTTTHRLVEYAESRGKIITSDPNLREPLWKDLEEAKNEILWLISHTDILKISDNEVEFLWELSPEEGARKILKEYRPKLVFVTCGAEGALFANEKYSGRVESLPVQPVDTTGAGDIFGGTAVAQLIRCGKAPEELTEEELRHITELACAAASISTESYGGISSVPDEETVRRRIRQS